MICRLGDDYFEVDDNAFNLMSQNAYYTDPDNGTIIKDWTKITEWIEQHGRLMSVVEINAIKRGEEHGNS